jgi:hypothetical protein
VPPAKRASTASTASTASRDRDARGQYVMKPNGQCHPNRSAEYPG